MLLLIRSTPTVVLQVHLLYIYILWEASGRKIASTIGVVTKQENVMFILDLMDKGRGKHNEYGTLD